MTSLVRALAGFAVARGPAPAAAADVARLSALDWIAVGRAGTAEPVARILHDMATGEGGAPEAALFGGGRAPVRAAALVNGATSHALDYDDTHFAHIGHPSVAVFPAALALGERTGASLAGVLDAALTGMELSVRVGLWLGRAHYQVGYHQTATAGAFGAAAAAGRLLGLAPDRMAHALGLAATRAAGLKAQFGTMGKPYNAGIAAETGVEAALLAGAGLVSNPDALAAFGATHHGEGDEDAALAGLGETWLFENVTHKFHACCHGLHAALEAAAGLDLAGPQIAGMVVHTHPRWLSVCNQQAPQTGLGAKFSYGTVLAMQALGHDTAALASYSDRLCADPRLQALRALVEVRGDETLAETEARLEVTRRDGRRLAAHHDLAAPMSRDERQTRVRAKAASLLGPSGAEEAWQVLSGSGRAADLAALLA